ncbi:hypothetical protein HKX48_009145 [Thoreauomyces humboldtii]|nr:hypothetical protein HKX48_009145 [Thoreauomyces humboldtii]
MAYSLNSDLPSSGGLLGDILGAFDDLMLAEESAPAPPPQRSQPAQHPAQAVPRRQNPFLAEPEPEPKTKAYTARVHRIGGAATIPATTGNTTRERFARDAEPTVARSNIVKHLRGQPVQSTERSLPPEPSYKDFEAQDDYWNKWRGLGGVDASSRPASIMKDRARATIGATGGPKQFNRASRRGPSSAFVPPPQLQQRRRRGAPAPDSSESDAGSSSSQHSDSDEDTPVGAVVTGTSHGRAARRLALQKATIQKKEAAARSAVYTLPNASSSSAAMSSGSSSAGVTLTPQQIQHQQQFPHMQMAQRRWQPPSHLQPIPGAQSPLRPLKPQPLIRGYSDYTPPVSASDAATTSPAPSSSGSNHSGDVGAAAALPAPITPPLSEEAAYLQYQQYQQQLAAYQIYVMQQQQAAMYAELAKQTTEAGKKKKKGSKKVEEIGPDGEKIKKKKKKSSSGKKVREGSVAGDDASLGAGNEEEAGSTSAVRGDVAVAAEPLTSA